jgi:hypothetical protein
MHFTLKLSLLAVSSLLFTAPAARAGGPQSIPSVVITVENVQPSRGVFLTPPWIGAHDGSFDSYDGGSAASVPLGGNEIESLAEDGNNGPITATFESLLPNAPQRQGVPGPFGPLGPGDRASVTLNLDPTLDRYFSYASMVIPSNDSFIANGNPMAHELFDGSGDFVGQGFIVSGDETNDAGTEVNDEIASNVAFLAQGGPNTGTPEAGLVVTPSPGFAAPGTFTYPDGILNYPVFGNGDFNDADDRLLSVQFKYVDLGGRVSFRSELDSAQEVQASPVVSNGRGWARLTSINANQLRILVFYRNTSGPVTAAHLHLGQAGTNGPVAVNLSPGLIGNNLVIFRVNADDLTGPLDGENVLALLNEMAAGNIYFNLHTDQNPAGELRGQVQLGR